MIVSKGRSESNLTVPPGHKMVVKVESYRFCREMEYTMQYKVPKSAHMQVRHSPRFMGLSATTNLKSHNMYPVQQHAENREKNFSRYLPFKLCLLEISLV